MDLKISLYCVYLILSICLTIWVARTLHRGGRRFLVDVFNQDTELADSVNHLLVVGFYLVNLGFVTMFMRTHHAISEVAGAMEILADKIGWVLLALGSMHFLNLYIFSRLRRRQGNADSGSGHAGNSLGGTRSPAAITAQLAADKNKAPVLA